MKTIYLILLALLMVATVSCEKKDENNDPPPPGDESGCSDHVLKRPYLVYNGDQTGFSVIIQTTSYVHSMNGTVYITFGYDGNFGSHHEMEHHNFYEEHDCKDYSIWRYTWEPGELTINAKLHYIVHVEVLGIINRYDGWFYTSAASHDDFSFYAIGDTRDGGDPYASLMNALAYDMDVSYYYRYCLLLHLGDFVYNGGRRRYQPSDQKWNLDFFGRECNNNGGNRAKALFVLSHVPVMGTLGNHDFWWDGHTNQNTARYYISNWPYKMYENSSGLTLRKACAKDQGGFFINEPYYSFDYGIIHFISFNTYGDYDTASKQYQWLENDLINNNKPWTVVFFHQPMYNGHGKDEPCDRVLAETISPLFKKYGVDIVLQGHQHVYTRVTIDKGTEYEIPYLIIGRGGVDAEHYDHPYADAYNEGIHFARFDVTSNTDSMHVLVTEKHWHQPGNIDDFYFKNRPKLNLKE